MKLHKWFDVAWACGHEQHALDEHDCGTEQRLHVPKISKLPGIMPFFQAGTVNYLLMYSHRVRTVKLHVIIPFLGWDNKLSAHVPSMG